MRLIEEQATGVGKPPLAEGAVSGEPCRACECTHGTVEDLLSLVPGQNPAQVKGDPFVVLSGRAAKAWLALFAHAQRHGIWQPVPPDPLRPELVQERGGRLIAHWTVHGLGYAMGVNRDTAGKALKELVEGGWIKRESPRNKGQFDGIDYSLRVPTTVTQADKHRIAEGLRDRGVEYRGYKCRIAARVLENQEIQQVLVDVELKVQEEEADLAGDDAKATALASMQIRRRRAEEMQTSPHADTVASGDSAVDLAVPAHRGGCC